MAINSDLKGKKGERELARQLREIFPIDARRRRQYSGTEGDDDVVFIDGIHVECKRVEALSLYPAIKKAMLQKKDTDTPIVCHRRNKHEWLAIVRLDDLPDLVRKLGPVVAEMDAKKLQNRPITL